MGTIYNPSIVRDGLVLHLDAANVKSYPSTGTTWSDLSSNEVNGTITGSTFSNNSFSFNGTSNVITAPNNTIFDTQTPSVEVWIKTSLLSQNGFFFEKGAVNTQYSLFQEGTTIVWRQGSSSQYTTTANYISTSQWAQIVGTYAAGSRNTYINGALVTSDASNTTVGVNSSGISIGRYGGSGYYYNGSISNVKVYTQALSSQEVKQNYNALKGRYGL